MSFGRDQEVHAAAPRAKCAPPPAARLGAVRGRDALLALQRLAGNAAVTRAVQRACPQGKQPKVVRSDCAPGGPLDPGNFIRLLRVSIGSRKVTAEWGPRSGPATRTDSMDCTPNPSHTPTGPDVVGTKCGINHTNQKRDGMSWFTGFRSRGLVIGFHNSQPVGPGFVSHGCVRVHCDDAKVINHNTWSDVTKIRFR